MGEKDIKKWWIGIWEIQPLNAVFRQKYMALVNF